MTIREAADRLARDNYSHALGGAAQRFQDGQAVADAWLADNPADSEMPICDMWLRSVGFTCRVWSDSSDMETEATKTLDGDTELILRQSETLLSVGPTYWPCETCKTRGDVRRVAKALGITLEEAK